MGDSFPARLRGQAEIRDLCLAPSGDHDVGALDVAVNDSFLVRLLQTFRNLNGNVHRGFHGQGTPFNLFRQTLSIDVGHCDERVAVNFLDLMDSANRRMVQSGGRLGFPYESFFPFRGLHQLGRQKLEGNNSLEHRILGSVYDSHAPFAKFLQDLIV